MTTETIEGRDAVSLLKSLIACPSVTPDEGGAIAFLDRVLSAAGFETHTVVFSDTGTPDITNFFAKIGSGAPHLSFAGHTDVVPTGDPAAWSHGAFDAAISDGRLYGRGAVDMKGGIAAFVAASLDYLSQTEPKGTISLLITGDEEGPAINGTVKLLEWAKARGERFDACIVGEPTNPNTMGEMIKVGRRGSLSGTVTVKGKQGHVAYPHLSDNPVPKLAKLVAQVSAEPLDRGNARFQPSNLEFISFDVGNTAWNVIPGEARARFNIRFNDQWSRETLDAELRNRLTDAAGNAIDWTLTLEPVSSDSFLTHDAKLIETLSKAIEATVGRVPDLSTSGGTSDARFIKNYCPVVEFGLVGQTMHQVDEHVALTDLDALTRIYRRFIADYFAEG